MEIGPVGPWSAGISRTERAARCREFRALSLLLLGLNHPLTRILGEALDDDGALAAARIELGAIPALKRRRLLSAYLGLLPAPRRGGDASHHQRIRRDEALRDLARFIGAELSFEQQAARIVAKAQRYQPASDDGHGGAEREALHRLSTAGLPVPGKRQVRRILAKQKTALDGQNSAPTAIR